ncbi:tRNA synthetase class I [Xylariaceae sp. FL0594]|nr:tRNA synthetase class I [Xylariaceae sp. FL0594]
MICRDFGAKITQRKKTWETQTEASTSIIDNLQHTTIPIPFHAEQSRTSESATASIHYRHPSRLPLGSSLSHALSNRGEELRRSFFSYSIPVRPPHVHRPTITMSMRPLPLSMSVRTIPARASLPFLAASRLHRRPLHLSTIEKREKAQAAWDARAERIARGEEPNLWHSFRERGYVKDIAGTDEQISELMRRKRIGVYVGIDPTAPSLHLGHLLPLMPLFWMYMHGYHAVSLVGGATCKVGDPTDRLKTRDEVTKADRSMYITKIHYQLKRLWLNVDTQARRHGYTKEWSWRRELANNTIWYNSTPFTEIVTRLFKGMRLGPMLSRETVKRKMNEGDGMSLAEFVYPMMQAWDWWEMFSSPRGVCMQIGGSDQYGNIVAGVDAVKMIRDNEPDPQERMPNDLLHTPVGFTVPLLTDASGAKFGKTAGNAMWLDPFMTSSFDLYGYFMRQTDADVERLLKLFTFLPLDRIAEIVAEHRLDPPKRHAHHVLAFEVIALTHSVQEAQATQEKHKLLYSKKEPGGAVVTAAPTSAGEMGSYPADGTQPSNQAALHFRPDIQLPESLVLGQSISRILYAAGLASSASDAHRLVAHQGAYVGAAPGRRSPTVGNVQMPDGEITFTPVKAWFPGDTKNFLIDGKLLILRRGKHFVRIVEMVSDEEWEASGQSYVGEAGTGRVRLLRERLKAANGGKDPKLSAEELAGVAEEVARIEREGDNALQDADTSKPRQIQFPPPRATRAAKLLNQFAQRGRTPAQPESWSVKEKTAAIDKVLEEAKQVLEQKRRLRDEALAKAGAQEPKI